MADEKKTDIRNFFSKLNTNQGWVEHKKKSKLLSNKLESKQAKSASKRKLNEIVTPISDNRPNKKAKLNIETTTTDNINNTQHKPIISNKDNSLAVSDEKSSEEINPICNTAVIDDIHKFAIHNIDEYIYCTESKKIRFNFIDQFNIIKIAFATKSNYYCLFHLLEHETDSLYKIVQFYGWKQKSKKMKDFSEYYSKSGAMNEFQNVIDTKIKSAKYEINTNITFDISENSDSRFPIYKPQLQKEILSQMAYNIMDIVNNKSEYLQTLIRKMEGMHGLQNGTLQSQPNKKIISEIYENCLQNKVIQQKIRRKNAEQLERDSWKLYGNYEVWLTKMTDKGKRRFYHIKIEKQTGKERYKCICYWGETLWSGTTKVDIFDSEKKAKKKYDAKKEGCMHGEIHRGKCSKGGYKEFNINDYRN